MRRLAWGGALFLLVAACAPASGSAPTEVVASEEVAEPERCGSGPCEVLEGVVTSINAAEGHLVVAVDLAWSPELRTGVGETRFTVSDATLFLPEQRALSALVPGEEVMVRATAEGPEGRHALSVVRVDRD